MLEDKLKGAGVAEKGDGVKGFSRKPPGLLMPKGPRGVLLKAVVFGPAPRRWGRVRRTGNASHALPAGGRASRPPHTARISAYQLVHSTSPDRTGKPHSNRSDAPES